MNRRQFTKLLASAGLLLAGCRAGAAPSSSTPERKDSMQTTTQTYTRTTPIETVRNDRFAGEVIDGNKAAHGPCGDAPPDGVADEHGVVIVPAVHIGAFQSHSTKALVVVFTGNAAVIVRPSQVIGGIRVRRNDFKQVSTHGVGDGLRYALCSAGGGEIHHQRFARSRYRAGSFRRSSRAGCGFTGGGNRRCRRGSHRRTAHTASGIAGAGSQQQGGSRCASNLQKLAAGNFILHTKHASIYVKCRESQRTAHASARLSSH